MTVLRAKFRVAEVLRRIDANGETTAEKVTLAAVYGADGTPNGEWSKWTPSGQLTMEITNPGAMGILSSGHEFFIDFTPAASAD